MSNDAQMVELVDTLDSKSGVREDVWVRVPLWVKTGDLNSFQVFFILKKLLRIPQQQNSLQRFFVKG